MGSVCFHLLKLALSSRALTCVLEKTFSCYLSFLDLRYLEEKDSGVGLLNPSFYRIQTGSHDSPIILLDGAATFRIVSAIML